jgi:hypothetical protein
LRFIALFVKKMENSRLKRALVMKSDACANYVCGSPVVGC